jgi:hypothetical protein
MMLFRTEVDTLEEEQEAKKSRTKEGIPLFLKPLLDMDNPEHDIEHPLFTFRPVSPSRVIVRQQKPD